jgi:hypothetical protein
MEGRNMRGLITGKASLPRDGRGVASPTGLFQTWVDRWLHRCGSGVKSGSRLSQRDAAEPFHECGKATGACDG